MQPVPTCVNILSLAGTETAKQQVCFNTGDLLDVHLALGQQAWHLMHPVPNSMPSALGPTGSDTFHIHKRQLLKCTSLPLPGPQRLSAEHDFYARIQ